MEKGDIELIEMHAAEDGELQGLWEQHRQYEQMLVKMENKPYLSPIQQQEMKEIKKKKLAGKTRLLAVLQKYRG